jgi:branched-chain amino acid transport system ATP-binding protein
MPLLEIDSLCVRYGAIRGTNHVSFHANEGEIVALVGSNGAGKSSTLKAILGMVQYSEGNIVFDGGNVRGAKTSQLVKAGIGFSPEGRRVFPQLTTVENLRIGGYTKPPKEISARQNQILDYFPRLRERASQLAGNLSGGEQQMLAIGRALMSQPKLLLLDEPSLGLAPIIVDRIGEVLTEIQARESLTVLLAEQNANWAMDLAHRTVILELGRTTLEGPSNELKSDPRVRAAYVGL